MSRCVIIGGADIEKYDIIKSYIKETDFCVFCDCGLRHSKMLGISPDLIVGDFDSHKNPELDIETIVLPTEKDDTDTVFAVKEAIKRGYDEFVLVGVVGQRLDHTLGNIYILTYLDSIGKKGVIVDDYSEMLIVDKEPQYINDSYSYFSLINITGVAESIFIENAKYPLQNAQIKCEYQYGISNEVIKGKDAKVWIENGKLLLIKVR